MSLDRPVTPNPYQLLPAADSFHVGSDDVTDGAPLKDEQLGDQVHRYFFAVHAVGEDALGVDADATPAVVSFNLAFKTLGRAIVHGTYQH